MCVEKLTCLLHGTVHTCVHQRIYSSKEPLECDKYGKALNHISALSIRKLTL
jgi:hypothetical protein